MNETTRIIKLFEDLFDGNPWLDVNTMGILEKLNGEQAAKRVFENRNTIWEIVNHLVSWRFTVLERIQGKIVKTPENNYIMEVRDKSASAWIETVEKLKLSQEQWIKFLKLCKAEDLEKTNEGSSFTNFELIYGILQHDAYHLGQIKLLAKSF
jgi:uncharacterized damage-inducible protein DinB